MARESLAGQAVRRSRYPQKVTDAELLAFMAEGLKVADMVRRLASQDPPVHVTHQALSPRVRALRNGERATFLLPWQVRPEHEASTLYRTLTAYAKWRRGESQSEKWLKEAQKLEAKLSDPREFPPLGAIMIYDPKKGFMLRNRRPDDEPGLLAAS